MKLNLTRRMLIPLPPEECLFRLQESVNNKSNTDFRFPLVGKYRLKIHNHKRFEVLPGFFRRGVVVEGFAEQAQSESTQIYIRLMPPLWFLVLFALFPVFIVISFYTQMSERELLIFFGFLILWLLIHVLHGHCSLRIFRGFDRTFKSLNAVQTPPKPFSSEKFIKSIGVYLLISILYLLVLAALGYMVSA